MSTFVQFRAFRGLLPTIMSAFVQFRAFRGLLPMIMSTFVQFRAFRGPKGKGIEEKGYWKIPEGDKLIKHHGYKAMDYHE